MALAALLSLAIGPTVAKANLISNGDFETGDLTGWTWTPTPNADPNMATAVVSFDTSGSGASLAFSVNPGKTGGGTAEGGGSLSQMVDLAAGLEYEVSLGALAIEEPRGIGNGDGGLMQLLIGGELQWSWDVEAIPAGAILRSSYHGKYTPSVSGMYELEVRFTRKFAAYTSGPIINHYADDISVAPVPEPGSFALLGLALAPLLRRRKRR